MSVSSQAPLKVLVVDDEPLARDNMRVLLSADTEVVVVGECAGLDAVTAIARLRPEIMFLDIHMPVVDGFELLDLVGPGAVPAIVFVTAFDQHALRAFEVHALDYLLKPFTDARFNAVLARAKDHVINHRAGWLEARIDSLLLARQGSRGRFLIPGRDKSIVVDAAEIDWIGAADYYVTLHCGRASHLLRESMEEMERLLDREQFVRVHRGTIVNLARVTEVHPMFRGGCELKLVDGTMLRVSRSRRAEFEARFSVLGVRR